MSSQPLSEVLYAEYVAIAKRWGAQAPEALREADVWERRANEADARENAKDAADFRSKAKGLREWAEELGNRARRLRDEFSTYQRIWEAQANDGLGKSRELAQQARAAEDQQDEEGTARLLAEAERLETEAQGILLALRQARAHDALQHAEEMTRLAEDARDRRDTDDTAAFTARAADFRRQAENLRPLCDEGLQEALDRREKLRRYKHAWELQAKKAMRLAKEAEDRPDAAGKAASLAEAAQATERAEKIERARSLLDRVFHYPLPAAEAEKRAIAMLYQCMQRAQAAPPYGPAALCFSGGGIRSATFNLGVLQRLAWHGLLDRFDYLSTVSGGGFIGSWLMAWACRDGGLAHVAKVLKRPASPLQPEPRQVQYLRDFSRYLSPRLSLLSVDTWTLASIYVRNLLLNWLVLIPLLLAALMLPRLSTAVIDLFPVLQYRADVNPDNTAAPPIIVTVNSATPGGDTKVDVTHTPRAPATEPTTGPSTPPEPGTFGTAPRDYVNLLYGLGMLCVAFSFVVALWNEPAAFDPDDPTASASPPRRGGFQKRFLVFCLTPLVAGAFLLATAWGWDENQTENHYGPFVLFLIISMSLVALLTLLALKARKGRSGLWPQMGATLVGAFAAGTLLWLSAKFLEGFHEWALHLFHGCPATAADGWENGVYVSLAAPLVLASLGGGSMLRIGVLSRYNKSTDEVREWWSRFGGWVLIAALSWLVVAALVLLGPALFLSADSTWARAGWAALGGASGLITIFLGKSGKTPATEGAPASPGLTGRAMQVLLAVAAPTFVCLAIAAVSLVTDQLLRVRFPVAQYVPAPVRNWAQQHLDAAPPCAVGVPGHFATLEVFDDATDCNEAVKDFLRQQPPFPPDKSLSDQLWDTWKLLWTGAQWRWNAAVDGVRLPQDVAPAFDAELISKKNGLLLLLIWCAMLGLLGSAASVLINLNRFSLHGSFRNRLVRAYLGASQTRRKADEFTGFSERDNFPMAALRRPNAGSLPIHVINATLNLAGGGSRLSWQDRKAESFIVSPLFAGSQELGYRDTKTYGGRDGISIGTALTISGAAVSPNMGSHSSPAVAFLLTLFNVRLGAWLGNPGPDGNKTYSYGAPQNAALHVLAEAFGLTDAHHRYVYLSDGGHFENLGLYEMVRRRCRYIIVCDAGADPDYGFEDLANAVRKVRIDFGIPITFDPSVSIVRLTDKDVAKGKYCAIGRIKYSIVNEGEDGFLVYIKPAFYKKNEPIDVRGYAKQADAFPQEPTANQFFTESQFESYRALGEHIVDEIQAPSESTADPNKPAEPIEPAVTLDEFRRRVEAKLSVEKQGDLGATGDPDTKGKADVETSPG
jgi:hypothetical protein